MCTPGTGPSRRGFLGAGLGAAALAATGMLASMALPSTAAWAQAPARPNAIPPAEALKRLQDGNARYVDNKSTQVDFSAGRMARAAAQYP
ncbi:MAG: hypothetical protein B7Y75_06270, partial [Azorhizobium sp. 35-67-5]